MPKHVHHDMIVEWAKDTSRTVQYATGCNSPTWRDCPDNEPAWASKTLYRFKPETRRYRIALFNYASNQSEIAIAENKADEIRFIKNPHFNRWLSDWIEYEV